MPPSHALPEFQDRYPLYTNQRQHNNGKIGGYSPLQADFLD